MGCRRAAVNEATWTVVAWRRVATRCGARNPKRVASALRPSITRFVPRGPRFVASTRARPHRLAMLGASAAHPDSCMGVQTLDSALTAARAPVAEEPHLRWSWERTIAIVAPPCWAFALAVELLTMRALSYASGDLEVLPAGPRALAYVLLLPIVMLACRLAVHVGLGRPYAPARLALQIALALALAVLQRPSLAAAASIWGAERTARDLLDSIVAPDEASLGVWAASGLVLAMNYALCVGLVAGVRAYQDLTNERLRRAEVERQGTQARLQALTRQLNPHFLFNVLNTVVALIATDPGRAQQLVTRTSDLLRRVLNGGEHVLVTLRREIELLEDYLEIQHVRHPTRLSHTIDLGPGTADALVPALILQPIVENAVLHGLRAVDPAVHVLVEVRLSGAILEVRVENPGPRRPDRTPSGLGIGLRNVQERLRTLYGTAGRADFGCVAEGRYVTRLAIPQPAAAERCR
jgi:hypothetical protein